MASVITLNDWKAAEVALAQQAWIASRSRSHPESQSPSLPGSSPTRFGDATDSSEGTEKGLCSDIEGAEPPPKKAEVKPRTRIRKPQEEQVGHSKKKLVKPATRIREPRGRTSPAEVKQPKQSRSPAERAAASKATARRKPQQKVKQEEQSSASQEELEQENGQVKQEKTPSQSDDDTIDYDNIIIPHEDDIWLCCPGGPKMKAGQKRDEKFGEWLNFARRKYAAKMKKLNAVEHIVYRKDLFKAMSTTNKSKFVNDMFTSKFMRTLTHTPSYIFPKYVAKH